MNIVGNNYFGIVTRDGASYRARVEVPNRPDVVIVTDSDHLLADTVADGLARLIGVDPSDVDLLLFGHVKGPSPTYAGAAVFDGTQWFTQFPAQEDLSTPLRVAPSPSYPIAAARARQTLAAAVGRPENELDLEFFEIIPEEHAD